MKSKSRAIYIVGILLIIVLCFTVGFGFWYALDSDAFTRASSDWFKDLFGQLSGQLKSAAGDVLQNFLKNLPAGSDRSESFREFFDKALSDMLEKMENASSPEEMQDLYDQFLDRLDGLDEEWLEKLKEEGLDQLGDYADSIRDKIAEMGDLGDMEKAEMEQKIDDLLQGLGKEFEDLGSSDLLEDLLKGGMGALDDILSGGDGDYLKDFKSDASAELDDFLAQKKQEVEDRGDLSDRQKDQLSQKLDDLAKEGMGAIGSAGSLGELDDALNGAKNDLQLAAGGSVGAPDPWLEELTEANKQELEDRAEEKKEEVDARGDLTGEQKEALKDAIDEFVGEQQDKMNGAEDESALGGLLAGGLGVLDALAKSGGLNGSGEIGGGPDIDTSGDIGSTRSPQMLALTLYSDFTGTVYLKYKSFGDYEGDGWDDAEDYGAVFGGYGGNYLAGAALQENGYPARTLTIKVNGGQYYLPTYLLNEAEGHRVQESDVLYRGDTSAPYTVRYFTQDFSYDNAPQHNYYSREERAYRAFVEGQYLSVPQTTAAALRRFLNAAGISERTPNLISRVAQLVAGSAEYDRGYDRALDEEDDVAVAFLETYRRGICQHYATAATLLYRVLGIPARYVIGYAGDTVQGKETEVSTENAHSWVEVYLDGFGWAQVEVTGSSGTLGGAGGSGDIGGMGGTGDPVGSLGSAKESAKDALDGYAEEKKAEIEERGDLTDGEKGQLGSQIDDFVERQKEALDGAGSLGEVGGIVSGGMGALDSMASGGGSGSLGEMKEQAKRELGEYGEEKKAEIEKRDDLSDERKDDLKFWIDEFVSEGQDFLDSVASPEELGGAVSGSKGVMDAVTGSPEVTGDGYLQKKRDEALRELDDLTAEKKAEVDSREDLSQEEKDDLKDFLDKLAEEAKGQITTYPTPHISGAVEGAREEMGDLANKDYLEFRKEQALGELDRYVAEKNAEVDSRFYLDEEERERLKGEIGRAAGEAEQNITDAKDAESVEGSLAAGKDEIDRSAGEGMDMDELKSAVTDQLSKDVQEAREKIGERSDLTEEQRRALEAEADGVFRNAADAMAGAGSAEELRDLYENAQKTLDGIVGSQSGDALGEAKERAKAELQDHLRKKQEQVEGRTDLNRAQKDGLLGDLQEVADRLLPTIDFAGDVSQVEDFLRDAKGLLDTAAESTPRDELQAGKEQASGELKDLAERAKAAVDGRGDLTPDEKEALKEQIDRYTEGALGSIGDAASNKEVNDLLEAGKRALDEMQTSGGNSEARKKAQEALQDYAEGKKREVGARDDLSAEEKAEAQEKIDRLTDEYSERMDGAATEEELDGLLSAGKGEMDGAANAESAFPDEKEKAKEALDRYAEEKKAEVDDRADLTQEEKQELKGKIDDFTDGQKNALDGAVSERELGDMLSDAQKGMDDLADTASDKRFEEQRDSMKDAAEDYADRKKDEVNSRGDLTPEQKRELTDRIDDIADAVEKQLEDAGSVSEMEEALEKGKQDIDGAVNATKTKLTYMTESGEAAYYNGQVLEVHRGSLAGQLRSGHHFHVTYTGGQLHVGQSANVAVVVIHDANERDVTEQYEIVYVFGTLTVKAPIAITITAGSDSKAYDGTALVCDRYVLGGKLAETDRIAEVVLEGSQTERGRSSNKVKSVRIVNASGEDVTADYEIGTAEGTLRVY